MSALHGFYMHYAAHQIAGGGWEVDTSESTVFAAVHNM